MFQHHVSIVHLCEKCVYHRNMGVVRLIRTENVLNRKLLKCAFLRYKSLLQLHLLSYYRSKCPWRFVQTNCVNFVTLAYILYSIRKLTPCAFECLGIVNSHYFFSLKLWCGHGLTGCTSSLSLKNGAGSKWTPVHKVLEQLPEKQSRGVQKAYRLHSLAILLLKPLD